MYLVKCCGTEVSYRQKEVIDLVGEALSIREIARKLHVTEKTVKWHLTKIFKNEYFEKKKINNRMKLLKHYLEY